MSSHAHADPQEALPLFRLMIWSNPHFIPAYVVGGMQIARNPKQYEAAVAFLKTGLERNDDNIEIAETLGGQLLSAKMQRWDEGYAYLQRGLASLKKRNGEASPLTEDEKDALQNTYRWLVINRREVGDHAHARAYALEGLKLFPEDVSCQRYLRDHPEKTSPK
jgi:tetratricopeptide (TPR) repeat protein